MHMQYTIKKSRYSSEILNGKKMNFQASEIGPDFQVVFHGTEERSNVDSILRFFEDLPP